MKYRQFLIVGLVLFSFSAGIAQNEIAPRLAQAGQFEKTGDYAQAVKIYLEILEISAPRAAVYNNLGVDYFELRKYDEALCALEKAIALDPQSEQAYFNLGTVLWNLKRPAEALRAFEKALALDPQHAAARAGLCDAYLASEEAAQAAKAVGCYEKLLARSAPPDAQSQSNYGVALLRARRFREAVRVFEESLEKFAPNAERYNNLGVAQLEIGRYKEAAVNFERALKIEPGNETMRYNLAIAQLADKNKTGALEQYSFLKRTNAGLAQRLFETIYRGNLVFVKNQ